MAIDMLIQEAKGMTDEKIMEVVRFVRFLKNENYSEDHSENRKYRTAGELKNIGKMTITDDFDEPLDDFKEYMG